MFTFISIKVFKTLFLSEYYNEYCYIFHSFLHIVHILAHSYFLWTHKDSQSDDRCY